MSETSLLNAKCGFSSFQSVIAHDFGYWDLFFHASCPNETNTLKLEQLNHQMAFCIRGRLHWLQGRKLNSLRYFLFFWLLI